MAIAWLGIRNRTFFSDLAQMPGRSDGTELIDYRNAWEPSRTGRSASRSGLEAIFGPRTVAVVGATEKAGSVGRSVFWNLRSGAFAGNVFPVNLKRAEVLGVAAFPTIASVPEPVDLAVIVTPALRACRGWLIGECVDAGCEGARVIISAGFKEIGSAGAEHWNAASSNRLSGAGPACR